MDIKRLKSHFDLIDHLLGYAPKRNTGENHHKLNLWDRKNLYVFVMVNRIRSTNKLLQAFGVAIALALYGTSEHTSARKLPVYLGVAATQKTMLLYLQPWATGDKLKKKTMDTLSKKCFTQQCGIMLSGAFP